MRSAILNALKIAEHELEIDELERIVGVELDLEVLRELENENLITINFDIDFTPADNSNEHGLDIHFTLNTVFVSLL